MNVPLIPPTVLHLDTSRERTGSDDAAALYASMAQSHAMAHFTPDGLMLWANEPYLAIFGYDAQELVGQHHQVMCEVGMPSHSDDIAMWNRLRAGQIQRGDYHRLHSDGRALYVQASYLPLLDAQGAVRKVIQIAADVTEQRQAAHESRAWATAISRSLAVVEFDLGGRVLRANDNFLRLLDYQAGEILGQHHRRFVDPIEAASTAYT